MPNTAGWWWAALIPSDHSKRLLFECSQINTDCVLASLFLNIFQIPGLKGSHSTFQDTEGVTHDCCFKNRSPSAEIWRCQEDMYRLPNKEAMTPEPSATSLSYTHAKDMICLSVMEGQELCFVPDRPFLRGWAGTLEALQVHTRNKSWQ